MPLCPKVYSVSAAALFCVRFAFPLCGRVQAPVLFFPTAKCVQFQPKVRTQRRALLTEYYRRVRSPLLLPTNETPSFTNVKLGRTAKPVYGLNPVCAVRLRPKRDNSVQIIVSPASTPSSKLPSFRFAGFFVPLIVSATH